MCGWLDVDLHLYIICIGQLKCWACLTISPMMVLLPIVHMLGQSLANDRYARFECYPLRPSFNRVQKPRKTIK